MDSADEFRIPCQPEQLLDEDEDFPVKVQDVFDLAAGSPEDAGKMAERVAAELRMNEPMYISTDQALFDKLFAVVKHLECVGPRRRADLIESLHSSLAALVRELATLVVVSQETYQEQAPACRSALKLLMFFLHWACQAPAHREQSTPAPPRRRQRKAGVESGDDGQSHLTGSLRPVVEVLKLDLHKLFHPAEPDKQLLLLCLGMAIRAAKEADFMKVSEAKEHAKLILSSCWGIESLHSDCVSQLVELCQQNGHLHAFVADVTAAADQTLAFALIAELTAIGPQDYNDQWTATGRTSQLVKNNAALIEALSVAVPASVRKSLSLLEPYWGTTAFPIRSALVTAYGNILIASEKLCVDAAEKDIKAMSYIQAKQQMLDRLLERFRDGNAYTRVRVISTWARLSEAKCIPIGHLREVTNRAIGALYDESKLVKKAALALLRTMLEFNPFGADLDIQKFRTTLDEFKEVLKEKEIAVPNVDVRNVEPQWERGSLDIHEDIGEVPGTPDPETSSVRRSISSAQGPPRRLSIASPKESILAAGMTIEDLRIVVADLELATYFEGAITISLKLAAKLLASASDASASVQVVREAIDFLTVCKKFGINGADEALKHMLPLVFSTEPAVKEHAMASFKSLYMKEGSLAPAEELVDLMLSPTRGTMACMEEIARLLLESDDMPEAVLRGFLDIALHRIDGAHDDETTRKVRGALTWLSMCTSLRKPFISKYLDKILDAAFVNGGNEGTIVKFGCKIIGLLDNEAIPEGVAHRVICDLCRVVLSQSIPDRSWFCAAEAAVQAIYRAFPWPDQLVCDLIKTLHSNLGQSAQSDTDDDGGKGAGMEIDSPLRMAGPHTWLPVDSSALSRLLFIVGITAQMQKWHAEDLVKRIRQKRRQEVSKQSPSSIGGGDAESDIATQIGFGRASEDAQLDEMLENVSYEILSPDQIVGFYAADVATFCADIPKTLACSPALRAAALNCLMRLMVVHQPYCEQQLRLFFTYLLNRKLEAKMRITLLTALGDLVRTYPNVLEPWTGHIYDLLEDPDADVRESALVVIVRLILNDMLKAKSQISKVAKCLVDDVEEIRGMAKYFFQELAAKKRRNDHPIYNNFPDILSHLTRDETVNREKFQSIMELLIGKYINTEKDCDRLVGKLCIRMESETKRTVWRGLSFCLKQLNLSEKGLKVFIDKFKSYKASLVDDEVLEHCKNLVAKAKRAIKCHQVQQALSDHELLMSRTAEELQEEQKMRTEAASEEAEMPGSKGDTPMENDGPVVSAVGEMRRLSLRDQLLVADPKAASCSSGKPSSSGTGDAAVGGSDQSDDDMDITEEER